MAVPSSRLVLGSSSPRRLQLLNQIGITPDVIKGADIDETPRKNEVPKAYVARLSAEKNDALAKEFKGDYILTADTTVAMGRRIIGKADDDATQEKFMRMFSGRSQKIYTAITLRAPDGRTASRLSVSTIKMKRLSDAEIKSYVASKDWAGCAGFRLGGIVEKHVKIVQGSPSGIIGLPLFETAQLLKGLGYGD
jgi:septum formation protein